MPDSRQSTEALLVDVERQLDEVDAALLADEPTRLQEACSSLRGVAISFARMLEAALSAEVFDAGFKRRVEAVAERLNTQRTSLARRSVVVERALASIMRPSGDATYSVPGSRAAFGASAYAGAH
ncbi:conserved hypothetical protein [Burkholderiales bacterium 8X]|nr:conserved hypothetical protein [Burkholderiales bacterium 8X]